MDYPVIEHNTLKQRFDEIDQKTIAIVSTGYYNSRLAVKLGQWEKGQATEENLNSTGVKFKFLDGKPNYSSISRNTGRSSPAIKNWHTTYKRHPDYEQYLPIAKDKADAWTRKAMATQIEAYTDEELGVTVKGKYQTIIIDPPWPAGKIPRDIAPNQGFDEKLDYPTMTLEQIKNSKFPFGDNCHVFLWTTHKYLPIAFDCFEAWNINYICTMVWHKAGGFQPFGLPQYNCEFILYGRKGAPKFIDTKDFFCCFAGERREHSRKPVEFDDIIRRVTDPPRIDIFTRETKPGFKPYGDELDKFNG